MGQDKFTKTAISIAEQISLFKQRRLVIPNVAYAQHCLQTVSYYRLSAYCKPFQQGNKHLFKPSITFQNIWDLYVFDRELRLLVMDVLERIEIALRTMLSNTMSIKYGACWYLDESLFEFESVWFENFKSVISGIVHNKHEECIKHYYQHYHYPAYPPSWMIIECLSFGQLTNLFQHLKNNKDKSEISRVFNFNHNVVKRELKSMRYTRNLCAHHLRLWNRYFVFSPRKLRELDLNLEKAVGSEQLAQHFDSSSYTKKVLITIKVTTHFFVTLSKSNSCTIYLSATAFSRLIDCPPHSLKEQLGILYLFNKEISPHSKWIVRLFNLFEKYQNLPISFEQAGFRLDCGSDPFWKLQGV